jgi:SAM-dependent methyltransferase
VVWSSLDRVFAGAHRVLDLGCGTGEDAVRLASRGTQVVAIDSSSRMVNMAEEKARQRGCAGRIKFHCVSMERLGSTLAGDVFDGVLSNFGALNCVPDLPTVVSSVAAKLRPGARLMWVLMGRYVPWEWAWYLLRADPARAWRRLRGPADWRGLRVAYPLPREVIQSLQPFFRIDGLLPLGFALPPTYAGGWLNRRPRVLRALTRLERMAQNWPMLASCADHYIVEATRLPAPADGT